MEITLKHYADYFAIALEIGLEVKEDIISWADNLILNFTEPSMWAIDLSTSNNKSDRDTINLLKQVQGKSNYNISLKLVIAKLNIIFPSIEEQQYYILGNLANWYSNNQKLINFDIPFINNFKIMGIEKRHIWQYFFDISKIPEYYQVLIMIGEDFKKYLPTKLITNKQKTTNY